MAEHDEKLFEHEFAEKLRKFDDNIKIPEIPDAQSIFDRAESEKAKVIPFKKYSRYVAAAAAVVLICVSIPLISPALSAESAPQEPAEDADSIFSHVNLSDNQTYDTELAVTEAVEEPEAEMPVTEEDIFDEAEKINGVNENSVLRTTLFEFFAENAMPENGEIKEHSSGMSSSAVVPEIETGDDLSLIELQFNKKRSIEVSVDKESVSVRVFDNAAGGEVISAFWVEGTFKDAYKYGESYIINLVKTVLPEDLEEGFYLPMAGDPKNGTYTIPEESVVIPEKITKGEIRLSVEIDVATGEYKINASLV